ncbi:MAG: GNAT family N-acetyltransferase [Hyphomicrobiaceae bacterium]
MNQIVIDCGPLSLVWIPNLVAPLSNRIKVGAFEMRCGAKPVGRVSFVGTRPPHAVIGYEVLSEFRGRGFASSAVAAVLAVAPTFGFSVLTAQCRSNNAHSRRVLEKSGFILSSSVPFSTNGRDKSLLFMVYQWIATSPAHSTECSVSPESHLK